MFITNEFTQEINLKNFETPQGPRGFFLAFAIFLCRAILQPVLNAILLDELVGSALDTEDMDEEGFADSEHIQHLEERICNIIWSRE